MRSIGKSQRALKNREKWRKEKLVAKSSVVPKRPSRCERERERERDGTERECGKQSNKLFIR